MKKLLILLCLLFTTQVNAWTLFYNYDNMAIGANCGFSGSTVSNIQAYSGKNSCQMSVKQGDTAFGEFGNTFTHPTPVTQGQQLWVRVRTFWPVGSTYNSIGEGDHLKFLRFHTTSTVTENLGYDDIYINPQGSNPPFQFIYEGEQVWDFIGVAPGPNTIQFGKWETYEYYVRFDTKSVNNGGVAEVKFWKNGVLLADMKDRFTLANATAWSDATYLFTYWNGGSPITQVMYVDDVQIQTDTPTAKDALGNVYIGTGAVPNPPTNVTILP